jgi:hypothetical protein
MRLGRTLLAAMGLAAALSAVPAAAGDAARPVLDLNQDYLEGLEAPGAVDIDDPMAVFGFVFAALPREVAVYPTENYFYFSFFHEGVEIAGNLRLDALDRDDGIVHFAYFSSYTQWNEDLVSNYRPLDAKAGVAVEKRERFVYDVTFKGRTVRFRLNDLSHVRPGPEILAAGEEFIGPVYDESGTSFFFVYNRDLRLFHFVLNEAVSAPDVYLPSRASDRIFIAQRTGFAYVEDRHLDRRILVGVFEGNSLVNNYFDGPFDQLPDNFIEGDTFRLILEHAFPAVAGRLDRFGNSQGGASRLLITPYLYYRTQEDLVPVLACADAAGQDRSAYYACFATGQPDYNTLAPQPAAATP